LDHQVNVDAAAAAVDQVSDRLEHHRPDDDRLDEVSVPDVVVEDARPRAEQLLDLLSKPREVGRIEGGLDLGLSQPVRPSHSAGSYAASSRAHSTRSGSIFFGPTPQ